MELTLKQGWRMNPPGTKLVGLPTWVALDLVRTGIAEESDRLKVQPKVVHGAVQNKAVYKGRGKVSRQVIGQMKVDHKAGMSIEDIAARHGVSEKTVLKYVQAPAGGE